MPRISRDELEYCMRVNECFDCHLANKISVAVEFQMRGTFKVPCCRPHFFVHKNKLNRASARKYAVSSEAKRLTRQCVYKGCHRKLIPQELLPRWIDENTCGMHSSYKAFRINRYCDPPLHRRALPHSRRTPKHDSAEHNLQTWRAFRMVRRANAKLLPH